MIARRVTLSPSSQFRSDVSHVIFPTNGYYRWKARVDFVLALFLLILSAPVILVAAALVKLTSCGPAFYSQTRLGLNGVPYRILKLRTMVHNCEKLSGPRWATVNDPRITAVGRFLRRTHFDELPQLWNVLRGDMSLVGPRPERPEFVPALDHAIPHYRQRLSVRPGVTGLAQIQLPADSDLDSVRRKLTCDLYYIQQASFALDFKVLMSTAFHVLGVPFSVAKALFRVPSGMEDDTAGGPSSPSEIRVPLEAVCMQPELV